MTEENDIDSLCQRALDTWGRDAQTTMVMEECGELIAAISHYDRDRIGTDELAEEMCQVAICLRQLELMIAEDLQDENAPLFMRETMNEQLLDLDERLPDDD